MFSADRRSLLRHTLFAGGSLVAAGVVGCRPGLAAGPVMTFAMARGGSHPGVDVLTLSDRNNARFRRNGHAKYPPRARDKWWFADADGFVWKLMPSVAGEWDAIGAGAVGDGRTPDDPAFQALFDMIRRDGVPATVYFPAPPVEYLVTARVRVNCSAVTLRGAGADVCRIRRQRGGGTEVIFMWIDEAVGPNGPPDFTSDWTGDTMRLPVAYGARSITLDDPAAAAGYRPGEAIWLRAGQTIKPTPDGYDQPVAEINQVAGVDSGSGRIALAWPTAKAYAASPGPAGIRRAIGAGAQIWQDIAISGLNFVSESAVAYPLWIKQAVRVAIHHNRFQGPSGCVVRGRFVAFHHNRVLIDRSTADGNAQFWYASDTGSSDIRIFANVFTAAPTCLTMLHLHEGIGNADVRENVFAGAPDGGRAGDRTWGLINVAGGSWNIAIVDNRFVSSRNAAIAVTGSWVDRSPTSFGLAIRGNRFSGDFCGGMPVAARRIIYVPGAAAPSIAGNDLGRARCG